MLHCRITTGNIYVGRVRQLKAADRTKLPLCNVWNGSNKTSL
jgi:hypothetical protein